MDRTRLHEILSQYPNHRILVFGDFFLDRYLVIDPALDEISLETGKTAYQVTAKRSQPGAAGTVVNNLRALEVGHITALTVIGDDGEGYELRQGLIRQGVNIDSILITPDRFTPTYTKPMRKTNGGEEEMNRQDIKNRVPLTEAMETELLKRLDALLPAVDAVIIADQVQERDCGVITGRVRGTLARLATEHPRILFFADSRERIGEFHNVLVKPNRFETVKAIHPGHRDECPTPFALECAETLRKRTGRPVFLTLDKEGICPVSGQGQTIIPCPPVTGPIDIVGAGDSVTAGIVSSLISGAQLTEAAVIGNLVASITIRQLGTTGTATRQQVQDAFDAHESLYAHV